MTFQLQGRKVLERDSHGPVVIAAKPERMSFRPPDRSKPVPLSDLEPGATFKLYWEGGRHPQGREGVLLLVNQSRARVRIKEEVIDKAKAVKMMVLDTDWSPGTLVIPTGVNEAIREKHESKGEPIVGKMSFNPSAFQPEVLSKEDTVASKAKTSKGNGKAKARTKKEPENKCGCGCGTMVMRTFAQGHDARFYGWAKKVVSGDLDPKDLPNATAKAALRDKGAARKVLAAHGK